MMLFTLSLYIVGFCAYIALPAERNSSTQAFIWISSAHTLVGLLCIYIAKHYSLSPALLIALFILPRLLISPMLPWLSDDAFRYIWDAHVLLHGYNPYYFAPDAPELALLRQSEATLFALLDYRTVTSVYPALSQFAFALSTLIGKSMHPNWAAAYYVWKFVLLCAESIGMWYVYATLQHLGKPNIMLLVYLLTPLPVIEILGQAHLDGLLCLPIGVICFILTRQHFSYSEASKTVLHHGKSMALGALCAALGGIKILPAIIVIPIIRFADGRERFVIAAACIAGIVILFAPMIHNSEILWHFTDVLRTNALTWQFNGVPYYALCYIAAYCGIPRYWLVMPTIFSILRSIMAFGIIFFVPARPDRIISSLLLALCAILLFSPKVHTWYFIPLLALNIMVGWRWLWFLASGSLLTYSYYAVLPPREQYTLEMSVWCIALCIAVWERVWAIQKTNR